MPTAFGLTKPHLVPKLLPGSTLASRCAIWLVTLPPMLPTLYADRIELRPWRGDDIGAVLDLYSSWDAVQHLGPQPSLLTEPAQATAKIESWQQLTGPLHGVWAIVPDGADTPIGTALMKPLPLSGSGQPSTETEIGWHLHPRVWGNGYASEAGARLLRHGWSHGLRDISALTYPQNTASQRVCGRIGMNHLGSTDAYYGLTCSLFRSQAPTLTTQQSPSQLAQPATAGQTPQ